jgi:hypothetical protein
VDVSLALEAERAGFLDDAAVKHEFEFGRSEILYGAIRERFLLPAITPTASRRYGPRGDSSAAPSSPTS